MTTITIDRAVLEQVMEALDWTVHRVDQSLQESIIALREALNAPQPQPVAWTTENGQGGLLPLYTTPPRREWEPLSLDQISMAWDRAYRQPLSQSALNFARDLENTLKERNHE